MDTLHCSHGEGEGIYAIPTVGNDSGGEWKYACFKHFTAKHDFICSPAKQGTIEIFAY